MKLGADKATVDVCFTALTVNQAIGSLFYKLQTTKFPSALILTEIAEQPMGKEGVGTPSLDSTSGK